MKFSKYFAMTHKESKVMGMFLRVSARRKCIGEYSQKNSPLYRLCDNTLLVRVCITANTNSHNLLHYLVEQAGTFNN